MTRKIDARELIAALGGLLVLISLFLDWFEVDVLGGRRGGGVTGWEVFEALDLVLAALAVAAIATGAAALGTIAALGPRALLPIGALLTLIVVVQLVSPPPAARDFDVDTGGWLALAGALLVLLGGLLRALRIDVTVNVGARDTRRRVPAVDRRPSAAPSPAPDPAPSPAAPPARRSLLDDDADVEATQPFRPVDDPA